ncbi:MAG TPA: 30S ribosomal protein S3 [Candidatus Absconditabacterales bacterium]|nr:30S ribosomal protein S3 [Candidatus Absconditabacterales bacterium]
MGQKVHPIGMRVGIMKSRPSEWFAKNQQQGADFFVEDIKIRNFIEKKYPKTGIAKIIIRKTTKEGELIIFTSKVGVLMGKNGENIKKLENEIIKKFKKSFKITVKEVRVPEYSAKIMAEFIASQLENRMPYRKVAKNVLQKVMQKGATGIKIQIGGRLNGAEIARTEKFIDGRVSLQTFRSDIDYHYIQAMTKYGVLGVKVWIEKGTLYNKKKKSVKKTIQL